MIATNDMLDGINIAKNRPAICDVK